MSPLERYAESSGAIAGFVYKCRYANDAVVFLCIIARQIQLRREWQVPASPLETLDPMVNS